MATSAYDKMDRPLWLQLKEGTSAAFYVVRNSPVATYRAFGPLASLRFDLGTDRDETRGYDFRYAPTSIAVSGSLFHWTYTTDLAGNVTGISQTLPTPTVNRTYGYQEWQSYLGCAAGPWNLAAASCNPATNDPIQWTYDKVGNRLSEARDGTTDSYAYQQNAATTGNTATLDQVTLGIGGTREYSFDAAGYLELVDLGANEIDFGFDEAGTLGTIARAVASESLSLAYDGRGFLRQADDAVTGGWLKPLYSSDGRLMSLERLPTSAGTAERINVLYFAGRPVAIWRKVGTSTATWNPIVTDHLGTPVYALTQAGAQHWIGGFEPFGRDHQQGSGQDSLTKGIFLRLPGQWDDPLLTGATLGADVYYNVHRWYDVANGRYSRSDPLGAVNPRLQFGYASNRPTRMIDTLGLYEVDPSCDDWYCILGAQSLGSGGGDPLTNLFSGVDVLCLDLSFIVDESLRSCINDRCDNGVIKCDGELCAANPSWQGHASAGSSAATICPGNLFFFTPGWLGDTVIHEWAHTCNWKHGQGGGVPFGSAR